MYQLWFVQLTTENKRIKIVLDAVLLNSQNMKLIICKVSYFYDRDLDQNTKDNIPKMSD